ncbi:MAG: hypothetical protein IT453_12360 [Planctomycetes bacterium]|nr:hypothetical protein [Planctomycetota bacterium]
MIRRFAALLLVPLLLAVAAQAQERFKLTLRTDPPVVAAGGWVDVVVAYQLEPGWRFCGPNSPNGPRAEVKIEGPAGWAKNSTVWAPPGKMRKDATHGDVQDLGGIGGMRQRFRVPSDAVPGKFEFTTSTTLTVGDETKTLAAQKVDGTTTVLVAATGARGPQLRNLDSQAPISEEEKALLAKNGFMVRARPEFTVARSKDVVCVSLDILLDAGLHEDALNIFCEPEERRYLPLQGWRAFHADVGTADGKQATAIREVLPLEFWDDGLSGDVKVTVEITLRTTRESDKASRMATQVITVPIRYER